MLRNIFNKASRLASKVLFNQHFLNLLPPKIQQNLVHRSIRKGFAHKLSSVFIKETLKKACPNSLAKSPTLIIGYLPTGSDGWILQFLFKDIARYSIKREFVLVKSIQELQLSYYSTNKAIILSMHPSFVPSLIWAGLPPEDVFAFYTHTRLGLDVSVLASIGGVLPMNSTEAATLALANLDASSIRVFPAGFDDALFSSAAASETSHRKIDVLFVARYVNSTNSHYHQRKNYKLIIPLAKALSNIGLKVCILGKDWNLCGDEEFLQSIDCLDLPHAKYPDAYCRSKLFVSPSLQEGGPVSWLEAMACGCLTLSNPTGFALELRSGELGSYLMTLNATIGDWIEEITRLLSVFESDSSVDMPSRNKFLSAATFRELAIVLESIAANPASFQSSLQWPSVMVSEISTSAK